MKEECTPENIFPTSEFSVFHFLYFYFQGEFVELFEEDAKKKSYLKHLGSSTLP